MAKAKALMDQSKLKNAIKALPQGITDEGEEFLAFTGKAKGKPVVGLYVGSAMKSQYNTDKDSLSDAQFFKGTIKKSAKDPTKRLFVQTAGNKDAIKNLAKVCLEEVKAKFVVVVARPGEAEPEPDGEDLKNDGVKNETPNPALEEVQDKLSAILPDVLIAEKHPVAGGQVAQMHAQLRQLIAGGDAQAAKRNLGFLEVLVLKAAKTPKPTTTTTAPKKKGPSIDERLSELDDVVKYAGKVGLAAALEKQTKQLTGTGKNFQVVLAAMKKVEDDPTSDKNLDLLEAAALSYLKHYEEDFTDPKKKNDKINITKRSASLKALQDVALLRIKNQKAKLENLDGEEARVAERELEARLIMVTGKVDVPKDRGASDSYFIKGKDGKPAYVFKPMKGEDVAPDAGFPPQGGAVREAMFGDLGEQIKNSTGLDFGICPVSLAKLESDSFTTGQKSQDRTQVGALITVAENDGGLDKFDDDLDKVSTEDIQKIALLDFMTLNLDRNPGNLLTKKEQDGTVRLIPIDAGNALPPVNTFEERCGGMGAMPLLESGTSLKQGSALAQLPNARKPFSKEMAEAVDKMDPDQIAKGMKESFDKLVKSNPEMAGKVDPESIKLVELSTRFLKAAVRKLNPYEMSLAYSIANPNVASLVKVKLNDLPTEMEKVISAAKKLGDELIEEAENIAKEARSRIIEKVNTVLPGVMNLLQTGKYDGDDIVQSRVQVLEKHAGGKDLTALTAKLAKATQKDMNEVDERLSELQSRLRSLSEK